MNVDSPTESSSGTAINPCRKRNPNDVLLASLLPCDHELHGLPGFYTKDGTWTLAAQRLSHSGAEQGRFDPRYEDPAGRRRGAKVPLAVQPVEPHGKRRIRSYSWIHVTGDTTQKRAYLTEGPLKGDIASYFANDALFVCLGGVNAHKGLRETLLSLGVTEVMEAMDMDQFTNPQVRQAIGTLRREVQSIPGIRYYQCTWNPRFKGVDDYLLDWDKTKDGLKKGYLMTNVTNFQDIIGAANGDKTSVLGKFLYFSLANILVEKEALAQLCEDLSIPYSGSKRISVSDAFRSATGDIKDRITVKTPGEHHIYAVYCRDNAHTEDVYSRELVKETLNQRTNQYEKLANIFYDRRDNRFGYDNIGFDADIDPLNYCRRAEELFELYQICANRRQIETICLSYLRMLEATKVSTTGHLYLSRGSTWRKWTRFETFIEQLSDMNQNDNALSVNSFYIIDDAKQRDKMTEEFYSAVKKEIALYQEKADYLIQSGSRSPSVMERWVNKIATLEQKKQHYEEILRRELDGLDDEFETLRLLSQELSVRANGLRFRKAA